MIFRKHVKVAADWPKHRLYKGFWLASGRYITKPIFSQNLWGMPGRVGELKLGMGPANFIWFLS